MPIRDRFVDPRSPDRRPRRAAYALPTLFTAGNIFLGYLSILRTFRGVMLAAAGYVGSGIVIRIGGMIRRRLRPASRGPSATQGYPADPEHQVG